MSVVEYRTSPRAEPTLKPITLFSAVMRCSHLNSEVSHPCPPSPLIIVDINLALPQGPDGPHSRLWIVPALSSNKSSAPPPIITNTSLPRQQWPSKCYQPLHCCEAQQCLLKQSELVRHCMLFVFMKLGTRLILQMVFSTKRSLSVTIWSEDIVQTKP